MRLGIDEAIERVAERTSNNSKDIRQKNKQRRNQVTDLFGVDHVASGDGSTPAVVYISVSKSLMYWELFSIKIHIQPIVSTVGSGTSDEAVVVRPTHLSMDLDYSISPDPHTHETRLHNHNLSSGVHHTHTDASDFEVSINGVNVTPYFMAQYGGAWIDGEGVYPSMDMEENYDLLEVASDLIGEGRQADADKILSPGYKPISITSSKPFQVTITELKRHSHTNR